jgi:hypothetical protein
MIAMSFERRLTHSLEWLTAALAAWFVLESLRFLETRSLEKRVLGDQGSWGRAGRVPALAGGLAVALLLLGVARALVATPPSHDVALPREPWVGRALSSREDEETRALTPVLERLVVRRARVSRGSAMRFLANERIQHWSDLFSPRPYPFTVFATDPELPENLAVFPGRLPEETESRELVLVGVPVHYQDTDALELLLLLSPEGEVVFRPERATALAHALYLRARSAARE